MPTKWLERQQQMALRANNQQNELGARLNAISK